MVLGDQQTGAAATEERRKKTTQAAPRFYSAVLWFARHGRPLPGTRSGEWTLGPHTLKPPLGAAAFCLWLRLLDQQRGTNRDTRAKGKSAVLFAVMRAPAKHDM